MGTLFQQQPRNPYYFEKKEVKLLMEEALELSKQFKQPIGIILKAYEIKEMERRNNLYKNNGDTFDEQMAGLGEILERMAESLFNISEKYPD